MVAALTALFFVALVLVGPRPDWMAAVIFLGYLALVFIARAVEKLEE